MPPPKLHVPAAAFSPDGKRLLTLQGVSGNRHRAPEHDTLTLWEVATGHRVWGIPSSKHAAGAMAFLPDGKQFLFLDRRGSFKGEEGNLLRLCNVADGKIVRPSMMSTTLAAWRSHPTASMPSSGCCTRGGWSTGT
jgi:WD40 repeat protein